MKTPVEVDQRRGALRKAGESMLSSSTPKLPQAKASEPAYPNETSGNSASSRLVRRNISTLVHRNTTMTEKGLAAELEKTFGYEKNQRVQLHHFGFGIVNIKSLSQPALVRRHSIDAGDLPSLRSSSNTSNAEACFTLAFSPNVEQLAGGFMDGKVRVFNGRTGMEEHSASIPNSEKQCAVTNVKWLPEGDSKVFATADAAGKLCLWDLSRRTMKCVAQTPGGPSLHAMCITPDRMQLVVAGVEHVIRTYDIEKELESCQPIRGGGIPGKISSHNLKIVSLRANPVEPNIIWSAGIDRKVLCWDFRAGTDAVNQIHGPQLNGDALDLSRDGKMLLTGSHRADRPLQLFDLRRIEHKFQTLAEACATYSWQGDLETKSSGRGGGCLLFGAAWDSDSNSTIVAAGQQENVAKVFIRSEESKDMNQPLRIAGELETSSGFWSAAVTTDGSCAAVGGVDGRVHLTHIPPSYGMNALTRKNEI